MTPEETHRTGTPSSAVAAPTIRASGVILFRLRDGVPRVLLLRNRDNGMWGFPKGRRDPDDPHEVATALREVTEETGYTGLALDLQFREVVEYVSRGSADEGRRKRVTYFLAEAPAHEPTLSDEHVEAQWADREAVRTALAYEQLRDLALHVLALLVSTRAPDRTT
ncbi:MAG: NUDIX domain-containing protein [Planctomycetes bacterium]|nr:NUDIX domain-containing protein [Planctomycetota bacterium]